MNNQKNYILDGEHRVSHNGALASAALTRTAMPDKEEVMKRIYLMLLPALGLAFVDNAGRGTNLAGETAASDRARRCGHDHSRRSRPSLSTKQGRAGNGVRQIRFMTSSLSGMAVRVRPRIQARAGKRDARRPNI